MATLRLFHQTDPFHEIETRRIAAGELVIGRGEDADWLLPDPTRLLSRRHCVIAIAEGEPTLRDLSANGVFVGADRKRVSADAPVRLGPNETVRFGGYLMVVEADDATASGSAGDRADTPFLRAVDNPVEHPTAAPAPPENPASAATSLASAAGRAREDGGLLEAFCKGAHLDASAFSDEDPEVVMRRLGAVYEQMVLGLTGLMNERTSVKAEYRMDRTSVRAGGNNPFRWANASRVAIDLLRERDDGFLSGPGAVQASFGDVQKHLQCVFAGLKASLEAALQALSPPAIEERISGGGLLRNRAAAAWRAYAAVHEACRREAGEDPEGLVNRAFRNGYGRRLEELDGESKAPR